MSKKLEAVRDANTAVPLTGKSALLVGGTSGCGKGLALVLARQGCKVTIVGRNAERGAVAAAEIQAVSPTSLPCEFISCDVRLLSNIKEVCGNLGGADSLDFLSLSCTRGGIQGFTPTSEGYDERVMSMYLGRYAWVKGLLPRLLKSANPRVISILSSGKHHPYAKWASDFLVTKCGPAERTSAAGWYNDAACSALSRLHPTMTMVHIYPGFVSTNWYLELPPGMRCLTKALMSRGKKLEDCGEFMAHPLLEPSLTSGCHLLNEFAALESPTKVFDDTTCDAIWARTVEVYKKHGL